MNGRQLAESLAWAPSKVSKLENGRQTPTDADILAWTAATGGGGETESLLASLHAVETRHAEWRRQFRVGVRQHQQEIHELDTQTTLFRVFEATVIPGMLQTAGYARARLAQATALFPVPADLDAAVETRVRRQESLYRADKRFHFVLTEAALRMRLCPPDALLAQLDRLISVSSLPTVRLGIIPQDGEYVVAPWHGFWLLDDDRVMVETYSAELNLTQPTETALYAEVFRQLAGVALYGRAARSIIHRVVDDLAASCPREDGA